MPIAKVILAPEPFDHNLRSIFLAGGISGWRDEAIAGLSSFHGAILNPRRDDWPTDPDLLREQIAWEKNHLEKATLRTFWLPANSSAPITMFELGKTVGAKWPFVVGIDCDHPRHSDLLTQLQLACPKTRVAQSIRTLVMHTFEWFDNQSQEVS